MKTTLTDVLASLPTAGERYAAAARHGSMRLGLYAPRDHDGQTPHTQDELYVVVSGRGEFVCGDTRAAFESGDVLFAPAGVAHRFENFSSDFVTWVIFYGPEGGEQEVGVNAATAPQTRRTRKIRQPTSDDGVRSIRLVRDTTAA